MDRMTRLVAAYIHENDEDVLELSLKSIINHFDHIYIIHSNYANNDKLRIMIADNKFDISKFTIIDRLYEHTHIGANGRARNAYLDILKQKEMGSYCAVIDSDEVLQHPEKLRDKIEFIETQFANLVSDTKIKGNIDSPTTLVFSDQNRGSLYSATTQLSSIYGDRVDQKLSRVKAREFLSKYFGEVTLHNSQGEPTEIETTHTPILYHCKFPKQ